MPHRPAARLAAVAALALSLGACDRPASRTAEARTIATDTAARAAVAAAPGDAGVTAQAGAADVPPAAPSTAGGAPAGGRTPNELGRIPILEYHLLAAEGPESQWKVSVARFRENLRTLHERGYRPVNVADILDRKLDLPAGLSPVVIVFDDASPGQFRYLERNGTLEIDPASGVGMLLDMSRRHADWGRKGVFCMLPAAQQGHAFFGDKGVQGQQTAWRFQKVRFLAEQGFELCNHTLYHARLDRETDARAQEFIARGNVAIDSAVPGYRVRTFALPLGLWPKNRPSAWQGAWTDPKTGVTHRYEYESVLEVAGGPTRSPHDPKFNPRSMSRVVVFGRELEKTLDQLDRGGDRYVSDGNPRTIARPATAVAGR